MRIQRNEDFVIGIPQICLEMNEIVNKQVELNKLYYYVEILVK